MEFMSQDKSSTNPYKQNRFLCDDFIDDVKSKVIDFLPSIPPNPPTPPPTPVMMGGNFDNAGNFVAIMGTIEVIKGYPLGSKEGERAHKRVHYENTLNSCALAIKTALEDQEVGPNLVKHLTQLNTSEANRNKSIESIAGLLSSQLEPSLKKLDDPLIPVRIARGLAAYGPFGLARSAFSWLDKATSPVGTEVTKIQPGRIDATTGLDFKYHICAAIKQKMNPRSYVEHYLLERVNNQEVTTEGKKTKGLHATGYDNTGERKDLIDLITEFTGAKNTISR